MIFRSKVFPCLGLVLRRSHGTQASSIPKDPSTPNPRPSIGNRSGSNKAYGPISAIIGIVQLSLIYHLEVTYGIEVSPCAGPSMVPTLSAKGDWIAINKWHRRGRSIQVGDLVDFKHPMFPGTGAVKRVVGMPGDFVVSNDSGHGTGDHGSVKMVMRDGEGIVERVRGHQQRMIQVPEGHCWLLGDNLTESRDSRTYGPLPLALVKGKVIARVLPLDQAGWLRNNLDKIEDV